MNLVVLLGATLALLLISSYLSSGAATMAAILTGFGLLVALLNFFHIGLLEREEFEKMEMEELSKSRGSESLFSTAGGDTFPARRSREQFERFIIPSFAAILFVLEALGAWLAWQKLPGVPPLIKERATLAMSFLGLMGMILFLLGKYSSGLARLKGIKLLRPSSAYMLLSAYSCLIVIGAIAAYLSGVARIDIIVARVFCVISGIAAVETLLALVLEGYRVRVEGRETRLLYESRLVGLLGQPEAIITTAAHALDYQFGFKVSDTWFYRFLESALGWLLLAQFAILVLSTCFVVIDPGDEALLECFGKPMGETGLIGPGLHVKPPWPIGQTTVYHTDRIQTFLVGAEPDPNDTVTWTVKHAKEENYLVASVELNADAPSAAQIEEKSPPVSLVSVSIPVQYQITNLSSWAYTNEDPVTLLTNIAERAVVRYLSSANFDDLMSRGRADAESTLQQNIQSEADAKQLGARILFVGLEDVHPPSKVADVFEQVVGASEKRESKILQARAHAIATNATATGESFQKVASAQADLHGAATNSAARAILFASQQKAYAASPGPKGIYEQQAYLRALVENSADSRKYIIATTNAPNIPIFNLEDKIRDDLIGNLTKPTSK